MRASIVVVFSRGFPRAGGRSVTWCWGGEEDDDSGGDRGGLTDRADPFAGFRFDADAVGGDVEECRDRFSHRVGVGCDSWPFGEDDAVEVDDVEPVVTDATDRLVDEIAAVAVAIFRGGVGEQASDVGFGDRPEQCIGDGVEQHVGVAVTDRVDFGGDLDPADPERATVAEAVRVITEADTDRGRDERGHGGCSKGVRGRGAGVCPLRTFGRTSTIAEAVAFESHRVGIVRRRGSSSRPFCPALLLGRPPSRWATIPLHDSIASSCRSLKSASS